jgi:hypothetical protein
VLGAVTALLFLSVLRGARTGSSTAGMGLSLREAALYSLPYALTAALLQGAASAERWGLARLGTPSATAMFVQAVGLSTAAVGAVTNALAIYYHPLISGAAAATRTPIAAAASLLRRYIFCAALALLALTLAVSLWGRPITALLFGTRYQLVAQLLPWTVLGASWFSLGQAIQMVSQVARDPIGGNVARGMSLVAYSAVLLAISPPSQPEVIFAKLYCACNFVYASLTVVSSWLVINRERRLPQSKTAIS